MSQNNITILQGYFDEVLNQKRLDLLSKYLSEKFIGHGMPYVGMGLMTDDSDGKKIIVREILPSSPADGKFMVGDEVIRGKDGNRTWNTFEEIRQGGLWGQGAVGTPLTVWVRRNGSEVEINVTRGVVKGFEFSFEMAEKGMRDYFKDYPQATTRLVKAIESGDIVAFYTQHQGQNIRYGRSAIWTEFGFVRIQDGKITEWWNSEETVSELRQLGFNITAPEIVKV